MASFITCDVWICILQYVCLKERYRYSSVCRLWAKQGGLIDQSVSFVDYTDRDAHQMVLSRRLPQLEKCIFSLCIEPHTIQNHARTLKDLELWRVPLPVHYKSSRFHENTQQFISMCVDTLKQLTSLTRLVMNDETLCDDVLKHMSNLQHLTIYDTCVTDVGISYLSKLRTLSIRTQPLITGASLCCLPHLRELRIKRKGEILGTDIARLTNLEVLHFNQNTFSNNDITSLTRLHSLSIWFNVHTGLTTDSLLSLTHLTRLSVCRGTIPVSTCVLFTNLRNLKCGAAFDINDDVILALTRLESLKIVCTDFLTSPSIGRLSHLTKLVFLVDTQLRAIQDIDCLPTTLRSLDLGKCFYDSNTLLSIPLRLTNLTKLHVRVMRGNRMLGKFTSLYDLSQTL